MFPILTDGMFFQADAEPLNGSAFIGSGWTLTISNPYGWNAILILTAWRPGHCPLEYLGGCRDEFQPGVFRHEIMSTAAQLAPNRLEICVRDLHITMETMGLLPKTDWVEVREMLIWQYPDNVRRKFYDQR